MSSFACFISSLLPLKSVLKKGYPESWYFSPEGKSAYESLSIGSERTRFFYNYLCELQQKIHPGRMSWKQMEQLCAIASVMSSSMVDSKLEFGGYPNILDPQKNPFVYYVKHNYISDNDRSKLATRLLRLLKCGPNNTNEMNIPFEPLTFLKEDEPLTDLYKIERDICGMCSGYLSLYLDSGKILSAYSLALDCMVNDNALIEYEVSETDETEDDEIDEKF